MAIIRCDKGHYYDNTKFSQCPHCGVLPVMEKEQGKGKGGGQPGSKAKPKSKPKLFSLFHRGEEKRQEPLVQQEFVVQEEDDSTIAMTDGVPFEEDDSTVAMPTSPQGLSAFQTSMDEDDDRTVAMPSAFPISMDDEEDDRTIAMPSASQASMDEEDDRTIAMPSASQTSYEEEDDDRTIAIPSASQISYEDEDDDRTIAIPSASQVSYEDEEDDRTIAIPSASQVFYEEDDDRTIAIPSGSQVFFDDEEDDDRAIAISSDPQRMFQDETNEHTAFVGSGVSVTQQKTAKSGSAAVVSEQETEGGRVHPAAQNQTQPADWQSVSQRMSSGFAVGWLVCINGVQKGRDYRLCRGFNRLGGSDKMDIAVKGDPKLGDFVSCAIVYDDKSNEFFAVKQEDENVFLNEESLKGAVKLTSGDRIKAGDSEFEFIAFCREGRSWDSYE